MTGETTTGLSISPLSHGFRSSLHGLMIFLWWRQDPTPPSFSCIQSSQLKYCGRRYALCVEWGECSVLVLFSFYPRSIELLGWMFHPRMDEKGVGFSAQLDLAKVREWERKFDRHKVEWKQVCKDANMWEGKKEDTGTRSQKFVIELEWVCPKFTHQLS